MNWTLLATMAIGLLQTAGIAKKAEDANDTGTDDLIGDGLLYAAKFLQWLVFDRKSPAPEFRPKAGQLVGR